MTDNQSERIKLESGLDRLGLDRTPGAVENLLTYMGLLKEWSGTYNLVAPREREFLLTRHLLDSLSIAPGYSGFLARCWHRCGSARCAIGHYQAGNGSNADRQCR